MDQATSRLTQSSYAGSYLVWNLVKSFIRTVASVVISLLLSIIPILNVIVWIATVFSVIGFIVEVVLAIVQHCTHKDIYFEEDGIRISTKSGDGRFIAWGDIDTFEFYGKRRPKGGTLVVKTTIPREKKPQKMQKFAVGNIRKPADVADAGRQYLAEYRAKQNLSAEPSSEPSSEA